MTPSPLRIGVIGAGDHARHKLIPQLRQQPGVVIEGVVNRSAESTARAARTLGIPRTYPSALELIADPQIDAVVIGTWPNTHCELTCTALAAGKHVLCEARMARNLAEARQMLAAAQAHPHRVAMLVPSPYGLEVGPAIDRLMNLDYCGDLRELVVFGGDDQFFDYTKFLHWRQDGELSGLNALTLGVLHETALRWVPAPHKVFAQVQTFEPSRPARQGRGNEPVTIPDSVQVLTQFGTSGRGNYHFSGMQFLGLGKEIHLYGALATIRILFGEQERVMVGRAGDKDLHELPIPTEMRGRWRVAEEFVAAIREQEPVKYNTFETGVRYMEFTEAVHRSAQTDAPVTLPLT